MRDFRKTINCSGQDKASAILNSTKMTYVRDIYKKMDYALEKIGAKNNAGAVEDLKRAAASLDSATAEYTIALKYNISMKLHRLIKRKMDGLENSAGKHIRKQLKQLCQAESIQ